MRSQFVAVTLFPPNVTPFSLHVTLFGRCVTLRVTDRVDNRRMFRSHLKPQRACETCG